MRPQPTIKLLQGTIIGIESTLGHYPQILDQFLGIPYAQTTSGPNRFRRPIPINASTLSFDASKFGSRCPAGPRDDTPQGEDCLNLNLYRPKARDLGRKLPVLVSIHGGSFNFGAGKYRNVANMVAWSTEPIIGISFNYRLGAFGFLASKVMEKEKTLNLGLWDQKLLFEWVRENVGAFGGDPDNVTVMGSSAGAHSIGHHLFFEPSKPPPFTRIILETGAPTARSIHTPSSPLPSQQFHEFLTLLKIEDTPDSQLLHALQQISTSAIKQASESIFEKYNPSVRWPFQPVIDGPGGFIERAPIESWKMGEWHRVPVLTGFNTNEGATFVPTDENTGNQFLDFFRVLLPTLSEEDLDVLDKLYPDPVLDPEEKYKEKRFGFGDQFRRLEQAYGHFAYIAPVRQTVEFAAKAEAPVYLYQFAVECSDEGANHGDQGPFPTFDKEIREISGTVEQIAGAMHTYWTSFVVSGDPNKVKGRYGERIEWPRYEAGDGRMLVFGEGNDEIAGGGEKGVAVQVRDDAWARGECEFWWNRTELFEV